MAKKRKPNRGIVLARADAEAIHRWLALVVDHRLFHNPIVALDWERAMRAAKARLDAKLFVPDTRKATKR